jgi:rRNA small subunit pseudouridine methyltransferase Nep1
MTDPDIPVPPKLPRTHHEKETFQRVIVVLDMAPLEIVRVGKSKESRYHLLNCDDHQGILRKNAKAISEYRPDIAHQCLLTLLDSPLNKAGKLQVYMRTQKGVLIEINPQTRIPRTFARFSGLMVQLLHKLSIKAVGSTEKLLNVIKNPITDHLPLRTVRIAMSGDAKPVKLTEYISTLPAAHTPVFFVGAMPHGEDKFEGADVAISVSNYPLSASVTCSKICNSFEDLWNII